MNCSN